MKNILFLVTSLAMCQTLAARTTTGVIENVVIVDVGSVSDGCIQAIALEYGIVSIANFVEQSFGAEAFLTISTPGPIASAFDLELIAEERYRNSWFTNKYPDKKGKLNWNADKAILARSTANEFRRARDGLSC
jgi:hypothetical protein